MKQTQWHKLLIVLPLFLLLLANCGQKGDLTRPSAVKTPQATTPDSQKAQE